MTRRDFIGGIAAAAATPAAVASGCTAAGTHGELKFCVFADIHYYPGIFPHDSRQWLERILDRAKASGCAMVLHLGDFCHKPAACKDYVDFYNSYPIPCRHVIGNHDDDGNTHEETLKAYGLECGHYHFDCGGFRFVAMDTNYFERDGKFIHYSKSNYHMFWQADQKDKIAKHKMSSTRVPPEQLEWLKRTLAESPLPCVIASHASFERTAACPDGPAVRRIINEANAAHPGKVRLVLNGHHHCDHVRILDNVIYMDVNSASYKWFTKKHAKYPKEYSEKWRLAGNTVMWDDPVSAIVTLSQDGLVKVEGQRSKFHLGITPQAAGYPAADSGGRPTTPDIQSFAVRQTFAI